MLPGDGVAAVLTSRAADGENRVRLGMAALSQSTWLKPRMGTVLPRVASASRDAAMANVAGMNAKWLNGQSCGPKSEIHSVKEIIT